VRWQAQRDTALDHAPNEQVEIQMTADVSDRISWPHAPLHELSARGTYFLTAGTYRKQHYFRGSARLRLLHRGLLKVTSDFDWHLEAWAVFSNHYHFIAHSPHNVDGAESLSQMLGLLHERTAKWINRLENVVGRRVWHNFWETRLTYEKSYLARLKLCASESGQTRLGRRGQPVSLVLGKLV